MSRRGGACGRCGAKRHGRRRHVTGSAAMTDCSKCGTPICSDHAVWDSSEGTWVCKTAALCDRKARGGGGG